MLETLRLRPPAYIVGRCAAAPVTLAGFELQQGVYLWLLLRLPKLPVEGSCAASRKCMHVC